MSNRRGSVLRPDNETLARGLLAVARLLALEPTPRFKREAFRAAAVKVRAAPRPLVAILEEEGVEGLHQLGLGYLMAGRLADWIHTGELPLLRQLEERHTALASLETIPGVGPRLGRELRAVGISDLERLRQAARDGRLAHVYGFGKRRVALVNAVLAQMRRHHELRPPPLQYELLGEAHG